MEDLLTNYNKFLTEIDKKNHKIKELELEEISISGSNFEVNGDIRPRRLYEF